MSTRDIGDRPGLQAERTDLSWVRTSTAMLANGGLLLLRHDLSAPNGLQLLSGAIALFLAILALGVAAQRRRVLMTRPLPEPVAAPRAVFWLAMGTMLLGVSTLVALTVPFDL